MEREEKAIHEPCSAFQVCRGRVFPIPGEVILEMNFARWNQRQPWNGFQLTRHVPRGKAVLAGDNHCADLISTMTNDEVV